VATSRLPFERRSHASDLLFRSDSGRFVSSRPKARGVAVAEVQPQRPVLAEHAPHLAEHLDHVCDVLLGCRLEAELGVDAASAALATGLPSRFAGVLGREYGDASAEIARSAVRRFSVRLEVIARRVAAIPLRRPVVAQAPVGRRGDDTVDRFGLQLGQSLADVADH